MQAEWSRLEALASHCTGVPICFGAGLVVQLVGDAVSTDGGMLSRGRIVACKGDFEVPFDTILVRISHADWTVVRWCKGPLKVLKASGFGGCGSAHGLDLTGVATCIVAQAPLNETTSITVLPSFSRVAFWAGVVPRTL